MAKMIPTNVPEGTPFSERRIFEFLKLDPDAKEWTVLHSLGLKRTGIGPYGEIDFVVLAPGKGIVCLEVKGGEVSCSDGVWRTLNRKTQKTKTLNKSPYLQAREGMFAMHRAIKNHFGTREPASGCPVSYAVVFPDVHAPPDTTEAEVWETFDIGTLREPISKLIEGNISATRRKIDRKIRTENVSKETMKKIRQFLRPDFDCVMARSSSIARSEEQLVALTEEQYDYLDIASINERALVTGAAGTGKTLLALEFARRENAAEKKVLLICYNRVLGAWLQKEAARENLGNVTVHTFHGYARQLIASSSYADEFDSKSTEATQAEIYNDLYPFYAELALGETEPEFDTLVIDEAQDLVSEENLAALNYAVRGGLAGGRWAIFGDFTRQAIYSNREKLAGEEQAISLIREYCPNFPIVPLRVNCRNTRQIGEETALLSGFDALPYRLAQAEGLAVDYRYFKNRKEEAKQVEKVVHKLLKEGVSPEDIVILSPVRLENSAVAEIAPRLGVPIADIRDIEGEAGGCIVFSTVYSFKGMESPAIILTGFDSIASDEEKSLLYVGMSRARSHLVIVVGDKIRKLLPELTAKKLAAGWSK